MREGAREASPFVGPVHRRALTFRYIGSDMASGNEESLGV